MTTHQRVLDGKPRLMTAAGIPAIPDCAGVLRVEEGDKGRGPVAVSCDACGMPFGLARRDPNATQPMLVGAGVGGFDEDGFTKF